MNEKRQEVLNLIRQERERQLDMFGSEWDGNKTPNDWVATISYYVSEHVTKNGIAPTKADFEDSLIKAGAVILAALEHLDRMVTNEVLLEQ